MLASCGHRSSSYYYGCYTSIARATVHRNHNCRRTITAAAMTKNLVAESKIQQCPSKDKLVFGTTVTDHMLTIEWEKGSWKAPCIVPYQDLRISPAASCLHYGMFLSCLQKRGIGKKFSENP